MCGIFGYAVNETAPIAPKQFASTIRDLFVLSESRGKEAAGLAARYPGKMEILRSSISASGMVRTNAYKDVLSRILAPSVRTQDLGGARSFCVIGHSRLVTTGTQHESSNNQPVSCDGVVGVHNGIIVNCETLWAKYPDLQRHCDVDSEIIVALLRHFVDQGEQLESAVRHVFREIEGSASIAVLLKDFDVLLLATNNGSLYFGEDPEGGAFVFCSERHILAQLSKRRYMAGKPNCQSIRHLNANQACVVELESMASRSFDLLCDSPVSVQLIPLAVPEQPRIVRLAPIDGKRTSLTAAQRSVGLVGEHDETTQAYLEHMKRAFPHETMWQDSLRRCTKCILPETMPFIDFDEKGVCSYCRNYRRLEFKGKNALDRIAAATSKGAADADCIVGMSGGRDSVFSLHYIKRVLGLNPVAYTYDWGMVTDLARRNISRVCAKLGVEHIVVSADITKKREFIRKNVSAWLRRPELGLIPLFMAGDKQYFYHLNKVRDQLGVGLAVLGENMLERTDFKTGFAGVSPHNRDISHVYTLPVMSRMAMCAFYAREYLRNPWYLNASLLDTACAYASYYMIDRSYVNLFNYIPWIEDDVVSTIRQEYGFELANDSCTTWRIGDGTSAFYNYIYFNVAGFTENDTFRSNQIREGLISREDALRLVREENIPRYETIHWYLSIIRLEYDMETVLRIIQNIPRRTVDRA